MSTPFEASASAYFEEHLGLTLDALLAPVEASQPAGRALRGSSSYSAIEQARRQDDASLPLGHWEYELKRADWKNAAALCAKSLATESKDLQLAAWLLEAQIKQTGFAGIAACMNLLQNLCLRYWDNLYPKADDGDLEYRANIFRWVNDKLLTSLRQVAITATGRPVEYSWSDLELARRHEQIKSHQNKAPEGMQEGVSSSDINSGMAATSTAIYTAMRDILSDAVNGIEALTVTLDQLFGDDSPSMAAMGGMLKQILAAIEAELHKRGVRAATPSNEAAVAQLAVAPPTGSIAGRMTELSLPHGAIQDRADAYARLAESAEYLMRLEPHSPVPYLVRRATEWGGLNTVELYQELFLRLNGQLNIFEMLGLEAQVETQ